MVRCELTFDSAYFEEEDVLEREPLSAVARKAAARLSVEEEESSAVESTRPTIPVFLGEPWK